MVFSSKTVDNPGDSGDKGPKRPAFNAENETIVSCETPLSVPRETSKKPGKTQKVGREGEDQAAEYLKNRGFTLIERNYWKKWGEIDIVAQKGKKLHFVEVKAVSHETSGFSPEDRVHREKLLRLGRTIETYLLERNVPQETDFQIDVLSVYLGTRGQETRFDYLEDVYLE